MKTTEEIKKLSIYDTNPSFRTIEELNEFLSEKWYSEEEIRKAIAEVKKWEHHCLSEDWEVELLNKLFGDKE
jgi:hypothetical protein